MLVDACVVIISRAGVLTVSNSACDADVDIVS